VLGDTRERGPVDSRWLSSIVHHLGISVTNRLLHDQDLVRQQQQEQYLHRVLKAQEDERRRVARELHDTVAQDLAALRLGIERAATRPADQDLRDQLHALEEQAHGVLQSVRRTLFDLRLSVLENMGFLPTLQWHIERVEREHGIRGILAVQGDERQLDYDTAVGLFRIFQESLQNIVQHAHAEHVSVTAVFGSDTVGLVIEDDGRGFDIEAVRARAGNDQGRGLGLLGMEERARLLGGSVEFTSAADEGTTLTVVVPLPEARAGANLLEAP
jgi:signal transduction histidine kinase